MSSFIYAVVGMAILNVIVDLIISNGRMSKIVKSAIAIFMFYILVGAVIDFINKIAF